MPTSEFEKRIGYHFKSPELLEEALRHGSTHGGKDKRPSNERLEFLGDATLNLCVAYYIYTILPQAEEGVLTRARASIINNRNLVKVGERIGVAGLLKIDPSVRKKGAGGITHKMIANAVEAIIGSIFIDGGYETCFSFVRDQFRLEDFINAIVEGFDAKSQLQEWCQKEKIALPEYRLISTEGLPHERIFQSQARVMTQFAEGTGKSKKEAETKAAAKLFRILCASKEETP